MLPNPIDELVLDMDADEVMIGRRIVMGGCHVDGHERERDDRLERVSEAAMDLHLGLREVLQDLKQL